LSFVEGFFLFEYTNNSRIVITPTELV